MAFFVCRETTTNKNISLLIAKTFAQSSSPDWAKFVPFAYSASLRLLFSFRVLFSLLVLTNSIFTTQHLVVMRVP